MTAQESIHDQQHDEPLEHPRSWDWDADGDVAGGAFVELEEAPTVNGDAAVVVLSVNGERRTFWLFWESLKSKFRAELERRASGEFDVGERIRIERGDWRESGAGRRYRAFSVTFPDRPRRSAKAILGHETPANEPSAGGEGDTDIPFMPSADGWS